MAPSVTLDLPIRPVTGAVTRQYPRLIRAISTAASACCMAASATATASRPLSSCASAARSVASATLASVTAWSRRLKWGLIDLIEHLACFDIGTFSKQAFLYKAADLGPDLGDTEGGRAAGSSVVSMTFWDWTVTVVTSGTGRGGGVCRSLSQLIITKLNNEVAASSAIEVV